MPRGRRGVGLWMWTGALVGLAGCRSVLETEAEMFRHFGEARSVNQAMVFGDLDAAHGAAARISRAGPVPGVPAGAETHSRDVSAAADALVAVTDATELASRSAALADACGSCHGDLGRGPRFAAGRPPVEAGMPGHMRLHAWATERLWEAVISRDESLWEAGADALDGQPLEPEEFRSAVRDVDTAFIISSRAHLLAGEARRAPDWPTRVDLLGRIGETCYQCHDLAGAGS